MTDFFSAIGTILIVVIALAVFAMYFKNIFKIVKAFKIEDYGVITILRVAGVFVFPLGVVMGFV